MEVVHALPLAIPSFAFPNTNLLALPYAPGYPCAEGYDIHVFHTQVHASQSFIAHELSFTGLFRILSFIRSLSNTSFATRRKRRKKTPVCPC